MTKNVWAILLTSCTVLSCGIAVDSEEAPGSDVRNDVTPAGTGGEIGYRKGGFPFEFHIVGPDGSPLDGRKGNLACGDAGWTSPFDVDTTECRALSLCTPNCETAADCPLLPGGPAPECRSISEDASIKLCALPCDADTDCPSDMRCSPSAPPSESSDTSFSTARYFGASCMYPDVPWAPHCSPSYCAGKWDKAPVTCSQDVPCCDGLKCTPSGACEK